MLNRFRADLGLKIFKVFRLLRQPKTHFGNQQDHDTYRHQLPTFIRMDYEIFLPSSYKLLWSCLGGTMELLWSCLGAIA